MRVGAGSYIIYTRVCLNRGTEVFPKGKEFHTQKVVDLSDLICHVEVSRNKQTKEVDMNNPHNLPSSERAITPVADFGKGINFQMSKERRAKKQARHKENEAARRENSGK